MKHRAKLVNNEFGNLIASPESEEKRWRTLTRMTALATNVDPDHSEEQSSARREIGTNRSCPVCSGQHGLWRCEKFRDLSSRDRVKAVLNKSLCFKCLGGGNFKDRCPKETFKCQVQGCVEDHNTPHPSHFGRKFSADQWGYGLYKCNTQNQSRWLEWWQSFCYCSNWGRWKACLLRGRSS